MAQPPRLWRPCEPKAGPTRPRAAVPHLWDAPLDSGLELYQTTIEDLYEGSSRIRMCLKCGAIDSTQNLKKEDHDCSLSFKSFPVLVTTSWKLLGDFFLTNKYITALQQIGVEMGVREVVTVPVETKAEIPTTVAEEEYAEVSVSDQ